MKDKLYLLQTIRGIAAVLVVLHHISSSSEVYFKSVWLYNFFNSSRALDIFFVLSGFIITYTHVNDLQKRTNTKAFLIKRFIRIYPIFWIVSLIYLIFYLSVKTYTAHDLTSGFMIKSFLLIDTKIPPPVRVAWTLSYEVVFYLAFGACISLGIRAAKFIWLLWFLAIITCYFILPPDSIPYPFKIPMAEILAGCLAGYLLSRMPLDHMSASAIKSRYISLLSAGILIYLIMWGLEFLAGLSQKDPIENRVLLGLASVLIIPGAAIADLKNHVKVPKLFLTIGDASYMIYLTHYLMLALFYKTAMRYPQMHSSPYSTFLIGLCALVAAIVFGILTHRFIEKPLSGSFGRIALNNKPVLRSTR